MNPYLPSEVGVDRISKSNETGYDDTTILIDTYQETEDNIEVSASGDLSYSRGTYEFQTKTKDKTVEMEGKWLTLWKKFDGKWKVIVSINNSRKPRYYI